MNFQVVILVCLSIFLSVHFSYAKDEKETKKPILPKDPLYITDIDAEKLYEQWEEADDEKLPDDELPPHLRPPPALSGDALDFKDPEKLMRVSKKGKTVMAFVTLSGNPTKPETEQVTQRWQVGLVNNHIKCERFVIADNRAIFVFQDGSLAYDAKEFLTDQPELQEYTIDNMTYHGKHYKGEPVNTRQDTRPKHSEL